MSKYLACSCSNSSLFQSALGIMPSIVLEILYFHTFQLNVPHKCYFSTCCSFLHCTPQWLVVETIDIEFLVIYIVHNYLLCILSMRTFFFLHTSSSLLVGDYISYIGESGMLDHSILTSTGLHITLRVLLLMELTLWVLLG